MKCQVVEYDTADETIVRLRRKGVDIYWRGYDIVCFMPDRSAMYSNKGVVRNGIHGFETVYPVNSKGQWEIELPAKRINRRNKRVKSV